MGISFLVFKSFLQDMFDPEIYLAQYETRHLSTGEVRLQCGRYRDVLSNHQREEILEESAHAQMQDRLVMYCVRLGALALKLLKIILTIKFRVMQA